MDLLVCGCDQWVPLLDARSFPDRPVRRTHEEQEHSCRSASSRWSTSSEQRGDDDRAAAAEAELPDTLDLPKDEDLVTKFGVDPLDLAGDEPGPG